MHKLANVNSISNFLFQSSSSSFLIAASSHFICYSQEEKLTIYSLNSASAAEDDEEELQFHSIFPQEQQIQHLASSKEGNLILLAFPNSSIFIYEVGEFLEMELKLRIDFPSPIQDLSCEKGIISVNSLGEIHSFDAESGVFIQKFPISAASLGIPSELRSLEVDFKRLFAFEDETWILLEKSGKLWLYQESCLQQITPNEGFCLDVARENQNLILLLARKQKTGFLSQVVYHEIWKKKIKNSFELQIERASKQDSSALTEEFIAKYLSLYPLDPYEIVNLESIKKYHHLEHFKFFVPKTLKDARLIYQKLGFKMNLALLEFFEKNDCSKDAKTFQKDFYSFLSFGPLECAKILAVHGEFKILSQFYHTCFSLEEKLSILECIPEFYNPFEWEELVPSETPQNWIEKRSTQIYAASGMLWKSEKVEFWNSFLIHLGSCDYSSVLKFTTTDASSSNEDPTLLFLSLDPSLECFERFVVPFYEKFSNRKALKDSICSLAKANPEISVKLFMHKLFDDELQRIVFWNLSHKRIDQVEKLNSLIERTDLWNVPECRNCFSAFKICSFYKIPFANYQDLVDSFAKAGKSIIFKIMKNQNWSKVLENCIALSKSFPNSIPRDWLFESFITNILISGNINLARDLIGDCIMKGVLSEREVGSIVYQAAIHALQEIPNLKDRALFEEKLAFSRSCTNLISSHLIKDYGLFSKYLPRLLDYSGIEVLEIREILEPESLKNAIIQKILPLQPPSFAPQKIISDFDLNSSQVYEFAFLLEYRRHSPGKKSLKIEYLSKIKNCLFWQVLEEIAIETQDERILRIHSQQAPPSSIIKVWNHLNIKSRMKKSFSIGERISILNPSSSNIATAIPILLSLFPMDHSGFKNDPILAHITHPLQSREFFEKELAKTKEQILKLEIPQLLEAFLANPKEISEFLTPEAGKSLLREALINHHYCTVDQLKPLKFALDKQFIDDLMQSDLKISQAEVLCILSLAIALESEKFINVFCQISKSKRNLSLKSLLEDPFDSLRKVFLLDFQCDVDLLVTFALSLKEILPALDKDSLLDQCAVLFMQNKKPRLISDFHTSIPPKTFARVFDQCSKRDILALFLSELDLLQEETMINQIQDPNVVIYLYLSHRLSHRPEGFLQQLGMLYEIEDGLSSWEFEAAPRTLIEQLYFLKINWQIDCTPSILKSILNGLGNLPESLKRATSWVVGKICLENSTEDQDDYYRLGLQASKFFTSTTAALMASFRTQNLRSLIEGAKGVKSVHVLDESDMISSCISLIVNQIFIVD